jgi:hypothetical protein
LAFFQKSNQPVEGITGLWFDFRLLPEVYVLFSQPSLIFFIALRVDFMRFVCYSSGSGSYYPNWTQIGVT